MAIAASLVAAACWQQSTLKMRSVSDVLTNANSLSGKYLWLCGTAQIAFEHTALYDSLDSIDKSGPAIWLNLDHRRYADLDAKEVVVIGFFTTRYKGHMNSFGGEMFVEAIDLPTTPCAVVELPPTFEEKRL